MFKILAKIVLGVFLASSTACYGTSPVVAKVLLSEVQTSQTDAAGDTGICTATAIGPHALMTAEHCEKKADAIYLRNGSAYAEEKIVERIHDGFDHTIYLLSGATLSDFVSVKVDSDPDYGEDVFTIGNPGEFQDYYQRGYVSGFMLAEEGFPHDATLYSFQAFPGASGSGIFDPDGNLVGILSMLVPQGRDGIVMTAAGGFALHFKQEDIDKAVHFAPAKE